MPRDDHAERVARATEWVSGRKSDSLHGVVTRYGTLRRFAPAFLEAVSFLQEDGRENGPCLQALEVLRDLHASNKRKLPTGTSTEFLSTRWKRIIGSGDEVNRSAGECAVRMQTRDDIRAGTLAVRHSKRFGHLDDFFIPEEQWETARDRFFARSGLPAKAADAPAYLERRLRDAFGRFLAAAPTNDYASVTEQGRQLSVDAPDRLDDGAAAQLAHLQRWLATHMRQVRLPDLLIEVDNDLEFTRPFLPPSRQIAVSASRPRSASCACVSSQLETSSPRPWTWPNAAMSTTGTRVAVPATDHAAPDKCAAWQGVQRWSDVRRSASFSPATPTTRSWFLIARFTAGRGETRPRPAGGRVHTTASSAAVWRGRNCFPRPPAARRRSTSNTGVPASSVEESTGLCPGPPPFACPRTSSRATTPSTAGRRPEETRSRRDPCLRSTDTAR